MDLNNIINRWIISTRLNVFHALKGYYNIFVAKIDETKRPKVVFVARARLIKKEKIIDFIRQVLEVKGAGKYIVYANFGKRLRNLGYEGFARPTLKFYYDGKTIFLH